MFKNIFFALSLCISLNASAAPALYGRWKSETKSSNGFSAHVILDVRARETVMTGSCFYGMLRTDTTIVVPSSVQGNELFYERDVYGSNERNGLRCPMQAHKSRLSYQVRGNRMWLTGPTGTDTYTRLR